MVKPKTLQTPWYDKTVKALQLAGMSDSTQEWEHYLFLQNRFGATAFP